MSQTKIPFDEHQLINFLSTDLKELMISAHKFIDFCNLLKEEIEGRTLSELIVQDKYRKMLLGGLRADLTLCEEALARFYRLIYGIDFDLDQLISRIKAEPEADIGSLATDIEVKIKKDDLPSSTIKEHVLRILNILCAIFKIASEIFDRPDFIELCKLNSTIDSIRDSEDGVRIFEEFLEKILLISPNYNEMAFKIISLNRLPLFYIAKVYPGLFKGKEYLEFLKKKMGWHEYFIPEVPLESTRRKYTIMGYSHKSLGDLILDLVIACWNFVHFLAKPILGSKQLLAPFGVTLENEPYKYVVRCLEALSDVYDLKAPYSMPKTLYLRYTGYTGKYPERCYFAIKETWTDREPPISCCAFSGKIKGMVIDIGYSHLMLSDVLKYMAPQMYLGISIIRKSDDKFEFIYYSKT